MPRNITTAIENLSAEERLFVIDLIKVEFPAPIGTLYWSTSLSTYKDQTYVPRVLSLGTWRRSMSAETSDLTLTLANVDGEITKLYNSIELESAQVSLIRYYPTIDEAIDPLWVGWGGSITLNEETAEWTIHFGLRGLTQRGLRRFTSNCWKTFGDPTFCPYDAHFFDSTPADNWTNGNGGLCNKLSAAITTISETSLTLYDTDRYRANDLIRIDSEILKIVTVDSTTSLTVIRGYSSTTPTTHSVDTLVMHASCTKTKEACDRRGMRGPGDYNLGETIFSGLRYFGGWITTMSPNSYHRIGKMNLWVDSSRLNPNSGGYVAGSWNASPQSLILPAVYGRYHLSNVPSLWEQQIDQFKWALFYPCEGVVSDLEYATIRVDDKPPGNFTTFPDDSIGVYFGNIGQRAQYQPHHARFYDAYNGSPYLLAKTNGEGPTFDCTFALFVKIEGLDPTDETVQNSRSVLSLTLIGRFCRPITYYISGGAPPLYSTLPNPIEVAVDYCVNGRFGPRLNINKINLNQALIESAYCEELITSTDETVTPGTQVSRYKFNGSLSDDKSAEAHLSAILDCCNGYYIQNDGLLEFRIRKAESYAAIDALKVLTDVGSDRNIIRENGKSTFSVEITDGLSGYVNNIEVSFADASANWQDNRIYIYDDERQKAAASLTNSDFTRTINGKSITLIGTTSKDQAQRLGALNLREEYLKRIKYTFQMSLKDSVKLAPGDIRKVITQKVNGEDLKQLSYDSLYVRIWEIEETDKFTATITAYKHDNDYYDNTPV